MLISEDENNPTALSSSVTKRAFWAVIWTGCTGPSDAVLQLSGLEPTSAFEGEPVELTIRGQFPIGVKISYRALEKSRVSTSYVASLGSLQLVDVRRRDSSTLSASLPAGLPVGVYDLEVGAPTGATARLGSAFRIIYPASTDGGGDPFAGDGAGDRPSDESPGEGMGEPPLGDGSGDPGGDPAAGLEALLHGEATIASSEGVTAVTLDSLVDPSTSFVTFNYTHSSVEVSDSLLSAQLSTDGAGLIFARMGTGVGIDRLRWSVIEIAGAYVQRGAVNLRLHETDLQVTVDLAIAVDPARSFVVHSWRKIGINYDWDEFVRARLRDGNTLELARGVCCLDVVEWQVIELPPEAQVTHGEASLAASEQSMTVPLGSLEPSSSFLLFSYAVLADNAFVPPAVANHVVRGWLTTGSEITFARERADLPIDISWSVVTWEAIHVQHGHTTFAVNEASQRLTLEQPVNPATSVVLLPALMRGGTTSHTAGDALGLVWFAAHIEDSHTLLLERGSTHDTANVEWTVIEFH